MHGAGCLLARLDRDTTDTPAAREIHGRMLPH
jgi:hypothetical protein